MKDVIFFLRDAVEGLLYTVMQFGDAFEVDDGL